MTAAEIARRLGGRKIGDGRWKARCPAHKDSDPSLSITAAGNGRVLLHDFGGCNTADVLAAVGLSFSDLFPESDRLTARQLARAAYGTPSMETDPARRAELLLRDFADREGRRSSNEILLRNKKISHAERILDGDRHNKTGWKLLAVSYIGLAELEWLTTLLHSRNPRDWLNAKRWIER